MADPLEDQINLIIDDIDAGMAGKYPFKLRDILEHPLDFKDRQYILAEVDKMKADADAYFQRRKAELAPITASYAKDASKASNVSQALADEVKSAAKDAKKAVVKPLTYAHDDDSDEILFVDKVDDALPKVLDALAEDALFVVDLTLEIDNFKAGRWLFPGSSGKNRGIFVSFPINPSGALDIAREQMGLALDAVKSEIVAQLSIEGKAPVNPPATPAGRAPAPRR